MTKHVNHEEFFHGFPRLNFQALKSFFSTAKVCEILEERRLNRASLIYNSNACQMPFSLQSAHKHRLKWLCSIVKHALNK